MCCCVECFWLCASLIMPVSVVVEKDHLGVCNEGRRMPYDSYIS